MQSYPIPRAGPFGSMKPRQLVAVPPPPTVGVPERVRDGNMIDLDGWDDDDDDEDVEAASTAAAAAVGLDYHPSPSPCTGLDAMQVLRRKNASACMRKHYAFALPPRANQVYNGMDT